MASVASVAVALVIQIFTFSDLHETIQVSFARKVVFYLRSVLTEQKLDSRIKIFSIDDRTVSGLGKLDLDLDHWSRVIRAISEREPAAVFVDKIFDKKYTPSDIDDFRVSAASWLSPVYPIVFVSPAKIPFRKSVETQLMSIFSPLLSVQLREIGKALPSASNLAVYGAEAELLNSFQGTGHTVYNGDGKATLFYKVDNDTFVPHLGLLAAKTLKIEDSSLVVDGNRASEMPSSEIVVNFFPKQTYLKRSFSMLEVVLAADKGKAITPINRGDYVVVLPSMYTGNTDWRETPFGSMPGGYYAVAVLHSVLSGQWIRNIDDPGVANLAIVAAVIGAGFVLPSTIFIITVLAMAAAILLFAISLFVYGNIMIFWLMPITTSLTALIFLLVGKNQDARIEELRLNTELATAKLVHHTFFPPVHITSNKLVLSSFYESSTECGGDWWMHSKISEHVEYVLIGDAVGHGVPAALVASVAFAVNSTFEQLKNLNNVDIPAPETFLNVLGAVLETMKTTNAVMTFQVAKFDLHAGTMEVANAGHTFPILVPKASDDDRLKEGQRSLAILAAGNPLGIGAPPQFRKRKLALRSGDRIIFYTDGMKENRGGDKSEPLRQSGLGRIVENAYDHDVDEMKKEILKHYLLHVGKRTKDDDATLVVVGVG